MAEHEKAPGMPPIVERDTFQRSLDDLRIREKAYTKEGDAIAAARRRLPMVEVDATLPLTGGNGRITVLDAFEGRRQLIAYYFMWHPGHDAAGQCEGCTWITSQIADLAYIHARSVTYAVLCQGPYEVSKRYSDFMGWDLPWYSAEESVDSLLEGRQVGRFHLVCYLRDGDRVFETYWTTGRGIEAFDMTYGLLDLTVYGRQEGWQHSPEGWPRRHTYIRTESGAPNWAPISEWPGGRPTAQWPRIAAGYSDDWDAQS
jgi:predicted dithiol-disulfide oxidoreductase (DUF899 family)